MAGRLFAGPEQARRRVFTGSEACQTGLVALIRAGGNPARGRRCAQFGDTPVIRPGEHRADRHEVRGGLDYTRELQLGGAQKYFRIDA